MASTIVRVSQQAADQVKRRCQQSNRTFVAEMDLIVEAGVAALERPDERLAKAATTKPRKAPKEPSA